MSGSASRMMTPIVRSRAMPAAGSYFVALGREEFGNRPLPEGLRRSPPWARRPPLLRHVRAPDRPHSPGAARKARTRGVRMLPQHWNSRLSASIGIARPRRPGPRAGPAAAAPSRRGRSRARQPVEDPAARQARRATHIGAVGADPAHHRRAARALAVRRAVRAADQRETDVARGARGGELRRRHERTTADAREREHRADVADDHRCRLPDARRGHLVAGVSLVRAEVGAEVLELRRRQVPGGAQSRPRRRGRAAPTWRAGRPAPPRRPPSVAAATTRSGRGAAAAIATSTTAAAAAPIAMVTAGPVAPVSGPATAAAIAHRLTSGSHARRRRCGMPDRRDRDRRTRPRRPA